MPDTGSVIGSTASGAAAGSAFGPYGTLIGAGVGLVGGLVSGSGTAEAQTQANRAQAQAAAQQSAQSFINYLSSRGTNLQQVLAADPRGIQFWQDQYQQSVARGDRRDFQTWVVAALQAAPGDPVWNVIASPTIGAGAQNTTLPDYVQIGGAAAQPVIAGDAAKIYQGATGTLPINQIATVQNVAGLFAANPSLKQGIVDNMAGSTDTRSPEQWLVDHITQTEAQAGGGSYTDALKQYVAQKDQTATTAAGGVNQTVLTDQQKLVNQNITHLLDGSNLASNLAGLDPALAARSQQAALQQKLIDEQRAGAANINSVQLAGLNDLLTTRTTGATGIYDSSVAGAHGISDASLAGLANLLGTRQQGAQDIYGATVTGAGGVRDAQLAAAHGISTADLAALRNLLGVQETGARDVYGAQLTQADTYAQSAQQAMQAQLAQEQANRARQGFTGSSSGSDLERARVMAQYIQAGAGARAGAGVSLEQTLANARQSNSQSQLQDAIALATGIGAAGTGYATNVGNAGVGRATSLAGAQEQNSLGQLQTGVNLATSLGNAGTTRATTVAGAQEQAATGRLGANTQLATTNAGLLDTNAAIARAQADFQNAMDKLNLSLQGQQQQIAASGLPNANASGTLSVQTQQAQAAYDQLNALMKTLAPLTINQASGPGVVTANPGSVLNTNQILGGALTGAGTAIGNTASSQSIVDLLNRLRGTPAGTASGTANFNNPFLGQTNIFGPGLGTGQLAGLNG